MLPDNYVQSIFGFHAMLDVSRTPSRRLAWNRVYTIFINGRLAILKSLKWLEPKKELNTKKNCVKMSN